MVDDMGVTRWMAAGDLAIIVPPSRTGGSEEVEEALAYVG